LKVFRHSHIVPRGFRLAPQHINVPERSVHELLLFWLARASFAAIRA